MHTRSRWVNWCWSAGFALVLAGCGQGETPKAPSGAAPPAATPAAPQAKAPIVVKPAAATGTPAMAPPAAQPTVQPAAKPASPASLEEATRVIDFRKFPMPEGATFPYGKSATNFSCRLRKEDAAQAAQFYRTKLAEAGWKLADDPHIGYGQVIEDKRYFMFNASKQGFFLSGGVFEDRAAGELSVNFTNYGNIDSRTLPRFAEAELKHSEFWGTSYRTDAKPDEILEFTRTELEKGGWREVRLPARFKRKSEPGEPLHLRFIQRGIQIASHIEVQQGKTEVRYQLSVLRVELPIMPETRGAVEFLDGEKSLLHLFYAAPAGPEKVLEFYRKELSAMGWTMRAGTDRIEYGKAEVILEAPEKDSMRLELLADKVGTLVLIAAGPGEEKKAAPKSAPKKKLIAGQPQLVTEKELRFEGKLAKDSPKVQREPAQIHQMKMSPDKTYIIDMESNDFDAYLRILDSAGKELARDDDSGDKRNARLRFTPPKEGNYQVVATRFASGQGNYVLKIRVLRVGDEKQP